MREFAFETKYLPGFCFKSLMYNQCARGKRAKLRGAWKGRFEPRTNELHVTEFSAGTEMNRTISKKREYGWNTHKKEKTVKLAISSHCPVSCCSHLFLIMYKINFHFCRAAKQQF